MFHPELREQLVEAARAGASEAVEEFHKARAEHFNGMTAEDHVADHKFVTPWRKFWRQLDKNITDGFWHGVSRVIMVITVALGVSVVIAFVGSLSSQMFKSALIALAKMALG